MKSWMWLLTDEIRLPKCWRRFSERVGTLVNCIILSLGKLGVQDGRTE